MPTASVGDRYAIENNRCIASSPIFRINDEPASSVIYIRDVPQNDEVTVHVTGRDGEWTMVQAISRSLIRADLVGAPNFKPEMPRDKFCQYDESDRGWMSYFGLAEPHRPYKCGDLVNLEIQFPGVHHSCIGMVRSHQQQPSYTSQPPVSEFEIELLS